MPLVDCEACRRVRTGSADDASAAAGTGTALRTEGVDERAAISLSCRRWPRSRSPVADKRTAVTIAAHRLLGLNRRSRSVSPRRRGLHRDAGDVCRCVSDLNVGVRAVCHGATEVLVVERFDHPSHQPFGAWIVEFVTGFVAIFRLNAFSPHAIFYVRSAVDVATASASP